MEQATTDQKTLRVVLAVFEHLFTEQIEALHGKGASAQIHPYDCYYLKAKTNAIEWVISPGS